MKLELKHIAPYLPYGLKAEMLDYKCDYVNKRYDTIIGVEKWSKNGDWCLLTEEGSKPSFERIKPILRPLSDLTKEIEHNGEKFVPIERILHSYKEDFGYDYSNVNDFEIWALDDFGVPTEETMTLNDYFKLFEWHFDVFNLIENGLAIDINTLEK